MGFKFVLYHGGKLAHEPEVKYEGGGVHIIMADVDRMSISKLQGVVAKLGYKDPIEIWFKLPGFSLAKGLNKNFSRC